MNYMVSLIKKILISSDEVDVISVAKLVFMSFCTISLVYAYYVFVQFSFLDVVSVALAFLFLGVVTVAVFIPIVIKHRFTFSLSALFWSCVCLFFVFFIANSTNEAFYYYFRTYPLLETELNLGWHHDSAFHASLIHSFKLFGFPSIGQHGTPITVYHTLSHFVDSIIINIVGVDVWQSYGMFFFFKCAFLILSIMFFLASVCHGLNIYIFTVSLVFISPIVVGTWHATGSHGLWFTSIVVVLSSPFVYRLTVKKSPLKAMDYFGLFFLMVVVSLGKVSTGFMYSVLVGFCVFFSNFKDYRVYILGLGLLAFFATFNSIVTGGDGAFVTPEVNNIYNFITLETNVYYDQLYQVYILLAILGGISWLFKSIAAAKLFISSLLSVFVLSFLVSIQGNFSNTDVWYFVYGLSSVLILLIYQHALSLFNSCQARNLLGLINFDHPIFKLVVVVLLLGITRELNSTSYSFFNSGLDSTISVLDNLNKQPFSRINSYDKTLNANYLKVFENRGYVDPDRYERPLDVFNKKLKLFMLERSLKAEESLLFVPKEIFEEDIKSFGGDKWSRGLLVYAVTGVPLVYGVESLRRTYGYADYDKTSLWVSRESFDESLACGHKKKLIVVEKFIEPEFTWLDCQ